MIMTFIYKGEAHFFSFRRKGVCAITPASLLVAEGGGDVLKIQNNIPTF